MSFFEFYKANYSTNFKNWLFISSVTFTITLAAIALVEIKQIKILRKTKNIVKKLEKEINIFQNLEAKKVEFLNQKLALQKEIDLYSKNETLNYLLGKIAKATPENICLDQIIYNAKNMTLTGKSKNWKAIIAYFESLSTFKDKNSPSFDVKLVKTKQTIQNKSNLIEFELKIKPLKK